MRKALWGLVAVFLVLWIVGVCKASEGEVRVGELVERLHADTNKTCEQWKNDPPVDCLRPTEVDCVSHGCDWVPNYPGAWCQVPIPRRCIPGTFDKVSRYVSTEVENLKSHQTSLAFVSLLIFASQVALIVWSEIYYARLTRVEPPRPDPHKKTDSDDFAPPDVIETIVFPNATSGSKRKNKKRSNSKNAASSRASSSSSSQFSVFSISSNPSFFFLDTVNFVGLFILSFGIHLWRLDYPSMLTWDECHFGYFVSKYNAREYLFDIHPPLAKMTFALLGQILGHDPGPNSVYPFKGQMNVPYHNINQYYHLRLIASFFGSLVAPVLYLAARHVLSCSPSTAIVTGSLVVYDTLLLMESRGILTDSQLIFWNAVAIYFMLGLLWKNTDSNLWLVATGFAMGCAFSVKFTALATLGLCGIESCFGFFIVKKPLSFARCLIAGGIGVGVFLFWWWCHFAILIYNHSEVEWQDSYFQSSLIGNRFHGTLTPPNFFVKTYQLVTTMIRVNAETLEPHYWTTRWHEWILGTARLSSARGVVDEGSWEMVMMMNPFVTFFTTFSVLLGVVLALFWTRIRFLGSRFFGVSNSERERTSVGLILFLVAGWVLNLLPYAGVERSTFVYHYLPGLLYAQILAGVVLDCGFMWQGFEKVRMTVRIVVTSVVVGLLVLGWWFFAPFVYALPLSTEQKDNRTFFLFKHGIA